MNYISFTVESTTIEELLKYYSPKVINKYCENCIKFSKVWTCPPLPFKDIDYVSRYKYCYIISGKVHINKIPKSELEELVSSALKKYGNLSNSNDEFSNTFNGLYHIFREFNDDKIFSLETYFKDSISLASGRCLKCKDCSRIFNKPCLFEDKLRYSLEGLGFDVSLIIENVFKDKIQWSNDFKPQYVTCVSALLSNEHLPVNSIIDLLESDKL